MKIWTYLGQRVSFVVVEPALHTHHRNALQVAEDQSTNVTVHSRHREVWNCLVVHGVCIRELIGQ